MCCELLVGSRAIRILEISIMFWRPRKFVRCIFATGLWTMRGFFVELLLTDSGIDRYDMEYEGIFYPSSAFIRNVSLTMSDKDPHLHVGGE